MSRLEDLKGILTSVNESIVSQSSTLSLAFGMQESILTNIDKSVSIQTDTLNKIFGLQTQINDREKKAAQPKPDTSTLAEPDSSLDSLIASLLAALGKDGTKAKKKEETVEDEFRIGLDGLLAGAAALSLAFAGLRGWEVGFIKSIKEFFGKKGFVNSIINGVKNIKNSVLSVFGIGENGKPLPNSRLDSITKVPWIKNLTDGISTMLEPIRTMFGTVSTNAIKFARTVGKILKPLGFLFSAVEGIKAWMDTEGGFFAKLGAFTSAFLGDFFGSFFDLLKDMTSWVLEKLGFDGAAEFLDSFSFETLITDLVNGIFSTIGDAWRWLVGLLPSVDEVKKSMLSIMPDWMKEFFGIPLETATEVVDRKVQENTSELAKLEAKLVAIEAANAAPTDEGATAPQIDTSELKAQIAAAKEKVNSPTQRIDIINQELKALQDDKAAIDAANAQPQVGRGGRARIDTSSLVAKIKALEAEKEAEVVGEGRSDLSQVRPMDSDNRTVEKKIDPLPRTEASGIYVATSNAAAESELTSKMAEQARLETESAEIIKFLAKVELVSKTDKDRQGQVIVTDASNKSVNTEYKAGPTYVSNNILQPSHTKGDLDYYFGN